MVKQMRHISESLDYMKRIQKESEDENFNPTEYILARFDQDEDSFLTLYATFHRALEYRFPIEMMMLDALDSSIVFNAFVVGMQLGLLHGSQYDDVLAEV